MHPQGSSAGDLGGAMTRREVLRLGGLAGASAALGAVARGEPVLPPLGFGRARSCLFVFLGGGPSHLDTFDPKPEAPSEVRGEFRPIATNVPGLYLGEHLPGLARRADRLTVVRSLTHDDPHHAGAAYRIFTGRAYPRPVEQSEIPSREDDPHIGSVMNAAGPTAAEDVPAFVVVGDRSDARAGRNAGRLGRAFDPLIVRDAPVGLVLAGAAPARGRPGRMLGLADEPGRVRDRYGPGRYGRSLLLGRRLIEAGTRFVLVDWDGGGDAGWDTHADAFRALRDDLLPPVDRALSALLDDLSSSGLLDETLVVVAGEFGRSPKISPSLGGRGHWPCVFSALLGGARLPGGRAYGASDRIGAFPADRPLSPGCLAATILHALGVSPPGGGPVAPDLRGAPSGDAPALDLLGSGC